jgi:predicted RNA-binding Zn ribbon-like protein
MTERWFEPTDGFAFAVRLLNSWDELEPDPELLTGTDVGARFLRRHGLDDAAERMDARELNGLRRLRTQLRDAWEAETDHEAVERLNTLLVSSPARPRLEPAGEGWAYRWDTPDTRASRFAQALAASGLLEEIRLHGRTRLGTCQAGPCRCVYVDRTKNRRRRFCCDQCADRAHQAAHRRRLGNPRSRA